MKKIVYIICAPPFWLKTPPLSLSYLKTYLEKNGLGVGILDLNLLLFKVFGLSQKIWLKPNEEFEENLFSLVENKYPALLRDFYEKIRHSEFVGFSLFKRNTPFSFSLAKRIKENFPHKKIIFGGPHTLFLKKQGKLNDEDFWVIGEGEIALHKIVTQGTLKTYTFFEIENLDRLPFLDFGPLNPSRNRMLLPIISSRGCPYHCNFCSEKELAKNFRYHSSSYIVEEIKYLIDKYKINNFIFCDSLINYKNEWLEDFCSRVIKNNLKIKWEAQMRVDKNLSSHCAALMRKSGCYNLFIGLESASDRVLKMMNKGFDRLCALNFFKKLKKVGLHFEISLIFGYPKESEKDFRETLNFIVKNRKIIPKIAQANPFVDYLEDFPKNHYPCEEGKRRVKIFLKVLEENKIRYTKSFINNLIYTNKCPE